MTLLGKKTGTSKGQIIDKGMDFQTNSLKYEGQFVIGSSLKNYSYESKISSVENHATEPRDRVTGARGGLTDAKARNGSVPAPKMAKIVEQYSKQKINQNIQHHLCLRILMLYLCLKHLILPMHLKSIFYY